MPYEGLRGHFPHLLVALATIPLINYTNRGRRHSWLIFSRDSSILPPVTRGSLFARRPRDISHSGFLPLREKVQSKGGRDRSICCYSICVVVCHLGGILR